MSVLCTMQHIDVKQIYGTKGRNKTGNKVTRIREH